MQKNQLILNEQLQTLINKKVTQHSELENETSEKEQMDICDSDEEVIWKPYPKKKHCKTKSKKTNKVEMDWSDSEQEILCESSTNSEHDEEEKSSLLLNSTQDKDHVKLMQTENESEEDIDIEIDNLIVEQQQTHYDEMETDIIMQEFEQIDDENNDIHYVTHISSLQDGCETSEDEDVDIR